MTSKEPGFHTETLPMILKTTDVIITGDEKEEKRSDIIYKIEDVPPWYLSAILGVQHYLTMFSGAISLPLILTPALCIPDDSPWRGSIISTTLFASGLASFLQATFGSRLPIIQGPSFTFLVPTLAILSLPQWQCPSSQEIRNMTDTEAGELWMLRMREVQGAILVGAVIEVLVGLTGLIGFLMKWITPLSIVPTITLIGLGLFKEAARQSSGNWWISSFTILLLIIFSQYLAHINIPTWSYSKDRGWKVKSFAFFKLFPVILSIVLAWGICAILTAANVFHEGDAARTDLRLSALGNTPWIRVPYPGQWGLPTFSIGPALGIIAGVIASAIESVGDYMACARLAGAPTPPVHAINRGIMVEGFGCIISGFCGTGSGLTSFSQNVGAIAITKVGSRRVIQFASVIIIIFGMIAKFGALFIAIPDPIMGGVFFIMFAFITGVGLSNLQYVNLNSSRNLFILGFSIFMGLSIPTYLDSNPDKIKTGYNLVDQILGILLKTNMFVGGFFGCFLDNTIPATENDRGLIEWGADTTSDDNGTECETKCYDMPFGMEYIKRSKYLKYLPISPTYKNQNININFNCFRRKKKNSIKTLDSTLPSTTV